MTTLLPDDEAALVSVRGTDSVELYTPAFRPEDVMPRCMAFMAACAFRYASDPSFVEEQLDWLRANVGLAREAYQKRLN